MKITKDIYVFIEQRENKILPVSFELLSEANKLVAKVKHLNFQVVAVVLGHNIKDLTKEIIGHGADKVIVCDDELLEKYSTQYYCDVLSSVVNEYNPDSLLIGATVLGRDLAPRVSARLNTGLTADATMVDVCDEDSEKALLLVTRPAFGGNLYGTIVCPNTRPQMATIRPNVFEIGSFDKAKVGEVINFDVKITDLPQVVSTAITKKEIKGVDISSANFIISVGRGMAKHLDVAKDVCESLNATMACSRAIVDEGLAEKEIQVGQTGKTVRPNVYIACGISGAAQHIAGMENADYIIAINTDPNAAIFSIANMGIVGDASVVLKELKNLLVK